MTRDIIPFPNPNDKDPWQSEIINTPQFIKVVDNGEFLELYKQDVRIDAVLKSPEVLYALAKFLRGAVLAGLNHGELEHCKDIVAKKVREVNGS